MQVETLKDVLHWTGEFHRQLAICLKQSAGENVSERARLLLGYLAEHEATLAEALSRFEDEGSSQVLNTWCYDYFDKHPIVCDEGDSKVFAEGDTDRIMGEILRINTQIIDLYRNLYERAPTSAAAEILQNLLQLEQHETMRMMHGSNRLSDV